MTDPHHIISESEVEQIKNKVDKIEENKEGIISEMIKDGTPMEHLKAEIQKCVLICRNCHAVEH